MVLVSENPFKSVEVETKEGTLRIDEGMKIKFAAETGEKISGTLTKISGRGEKTKLQIIPYGAQKEEIWALAVMMESSLGIDDSEDEE
jgi:predicted transcriptional regulator